MDTQHHEELRGAGIHAVTEETTALQVSLERAKW